MRVLIAIFIGFLLLCNFFIKSNSEFGIDVERYSLVLEQGVGDWSIYYVKEFISWGILNVLSTLSPYLNVSQQLVLLDVIVLVVLIVGCRGTKFNAWRFVFFYVSFAFVLLSFNVLRQYISLAFLIIALTAAVNGWRWRFAVAMFLAMASHNGAVLLLPGLVFVYFRNFKPTNKALLLLLAVGVLALLASNDAVQRVFETGSDALEEPFWKVMLYALLSFYMFMLFHARRHDILRIYPELTGAENRARFVSLSLLLSGILISLTPFSNWIISRNWISIISLQIFIYLCFAGTRLYTYTAAKRFFFLYFIPMAFLVFMHPGSRQMAFGA